jgi:sulfur-carrier protein
VPATVRIPTQLRPAVGGVAEAEASGETVREVLDDLFGRFAELRERISDEDGSLRRFVNVYLAGEDIRFLDGLETPVAEGAELTILPAVAGG